MPVTEEVGLLIRKYAIKNAVDYGKAEPGSVLSKVVKAAAGVPIPELKAEVQGTVDAVNGMDKAGLEREYAPFAAEFEQKAKASAEKSEKPRMELEGAVVGQFATRFAPEPSGYAHLGHAKAAWLGREFADMYKGTLALYFDDTNPSKEKQEFVDEIKGDLGWLGLKFDREYYSSDHMDALYGFAEKLIGGGDAYVCSCAQDTMKELRFAGKGCEHRDRPVGENLSLWKRMLGGELGENEVVLRLKLDMASLNTTVRDPVAFRIMTEPHYRQGTKYRVWPTYDFNTPIVDSLEGITDVIRDKDYELRDELYGRILDLLALRKPRIRSMARLKIIGNMTSKRKTNALIEDGSLSGYDDPRLITVPGMRRRGIQPRAIREFVLKSGMSKNDSRVSIDVLLSENKAVIDPVAKHLFFVKDPFRVVVKGEGERPVKLRLHPTADLGTRDYSTWDEFYISKEDADLLNEGDTFRLKDLMAVKVASLDEKGMVAVAVAENEGKVLQWVSGRDYVECSVLIPGSLVDDKGEFIKDSLGTAGGYAEDYVDKLDAHDIVQFERFGYCILDDKESMRFILVSK